MNWGHPSQFVKGPQGCGKICRKQLGKTVFGSVSHDCKTFFRKNRVSLSEVVRQLCAIQINQQWGGASEKSNQSLPHGRDFFLHCFPIGFGPIPFFTAIQLGILWSRPVVRSASAVLRVWELKNWAFHRA